MQAASASASSTASLVPEPMEKWAVWAASPSSTVLPWDQRSLTTVRKAIQAELLPRRGRPPRASAKIFAHWSVDCASSQVSRPAARQTSSRISMMTVLVPHWFCGPEGLVEGWSRGDGRAKG